ncbi:YqjF family protein [Geodermatophilus sp. SYSU D00691]
MDDGRPVLLRQALSDVAFLHWPLDPALAAAHLPPGTWPDVLDGTTYAGVVALRISRTAPGRGPRVPWLGSFDEMNVRLYSVDGRGRRAVVFLRMDAGRLVPVLAARAGLRLPYVWSRTRVRRDGDRYEAVAGPRRIELRIGGPVVPGPRELFLTARWGLHTRVAGRTVHLPLAHRPWPLCAAELTVLDGDPLAAAGLPPITVPPLSVLFSPGVDDARFGPPSGG